MKLLNSSEVVRRFDVALLMVLMVLIGEAIPRATAAIHTGYWHQTENTLDEGRYLCSIWR